MLGLNPTPPLPLYWSNRQGTLLALIAAGLACAVMIYASSFPVASHGNGHESMRIDPNTAPLEVIQTLPRIGPARARDWVKARQKRPFRSLRDIETRVPGIGRATAQTLEPFLVFDPRTTPRPRSTRTQREDSRATLATAPATP